MNTILGDAALYFATFRHWRVFPVAAGKKAPPLVEHGCHDASDDPATIRPWWAKHPTANVAIATGQVSGIVVLDVDINNGKARPPNARRNGSTVRSIPDADTEDP
jgi:hypothetical protein